MLPTGNASAVLFFHPHSVSRGLKDIFCQKWAAFRFMFMEQVTLRRIWLILTRKFSDDLHSLLGRQGSSLRHVRLVLFALRSLVQQLLRTRAPDTVKKR